jgi:arylsulfatase
MEEEAEDVDYPPDPAFKAKHGTRGVLHTYATATDDPTVDPRFGKVGKQRIENTGPLTKKRMETVDREFTDASFKFMDKAQADGKPFFAWINSTRMHVFPHVPQKYLDAAKAVSSGDDIHAAGMIQHDEDVGLILKKLEDMGVLDNTIVIYSTDNGPEHSTFPFGGTTPYRGDKMTTWEGAFRVPMMVRWPGHIKPRSELNGISCHEDTFVTLAAAAGVPDVKERLAKGDKLGTETEHRSYIDGMNQLDYWTGKTDNSARDRFYYYAESNLQAIRWGNWKVHFAIRTGYYGTTTSQDFPLIFNLRQDPFESYDQAPGPRATMAQHKLFISHGVVDMIGEHLATLKEYPPRQKAASANVQKIIDGILNAHGSR